MTHKWTDHRDREVVTEAPDMSAIAVSWTDDGLVNIEVIEAFAETEGGLVLKSGMRVDLLPDMARKVASDILVRADRAEAANA